MNRSPLTVYNASAGSGKTFTIAAEYIAILLQGGPYMHRHILAVTFTNKATEEMKTRIVNNLAGLAGRIDGDAEFLRAVRERLPEGFTDELIGERSKQVLTALLHDYDHFHIMTIDSFFGWLLALLARELGLTTEYKMNLDAKLSIEKGVKRLMKRAEADPGVLQMLVSYTMGKIAEGNSWDVSRELIHFAEQLYNENYMLNEDIINSSLSQNGVETLKNSFINEKKRIVKQWRSWGSDLDLFIQQEAGGYECFNDLKRTLGSFLRKLSAGECAEVSVKVRQLAESSPMDEASGVAVTNSWLKKSNRDKWNDIAPWGEKIKQRLADLIVQYDHSVVLYNTATLCLKRFSPLCLLNETGYEIERQNEEEGLFMLAKTPKLFYELVKDTDAPFVFEKAGTRYSHVLIDEFQDTSLIQWENFKNLLMGNLASGDKCLLVGDVKQSIYRFRGGDYRLLQNINNDMPNIRPHIVSLDTNFRSTDEVIDFNNAFFPKMSEIIFAVHKDGNDSVDAQWIREHVYHKDGVFQEKRGKTGGVVWIEGVAYNDNKDDEPMNDKEVDGSADATANYEVEQRMARVVCDLHKQGLPYNEIAILIRNKKEADSILAYFNQYYNEIPICSDEAFLLSSSRAVQALIHALRYLSNSNDKIAEEVVKAYLNKSFKDEMDETALDDVMSLLRPAHLGKTLYETCEQLIKILGLHTNEEETPYLLYLLDKVLEFVGANPADNDNFLKYWDEKLSSASITGGKLDGIRILTIHKSKGLAFHTVMVPFCNWPIERDMSNELIWCRPKHAPFDALPLFPITTYNKEIKKSDFAGDYQIEHLQQRIENLNLLYVAFTRPKQNLYAWFYIYPSESKGKESIGRFVQQAVADVSVARHISKSHVNPNYLHKNTYSDDAAEISCKFSVHDAKYNFVQSKNAELFLNANIDDKGVCYLERGKLYHALLSQISTAADVDKVCRQYFLQGLITDQQTCLECAEYLRSRLNQVKDLGWFDGKWQLKNECEILYQDENGNYKNCRPDRVMIDGNKAVVVDYKSGRYPHKKNKDKYEKQVRQYMNHLQQMHYTEVKGYIWYIDAEVVETVI